MAKKATQTLQLEGTLRIQDAEDTRKIILEHLSNANTPRIDLSGIESFDTMGVQVLISATADRRIEWLNAPQSLQGQCEAIGYAFENFTHSKSKRP